jgi:phosphoribosylaminoimidazolecarboxamide formyltransferase / IMP cyclohydrolase
MTKYALLSVFNKTNIEHLARFLVSKDYKLLSSGGTAKFLASNSIPVMEVSNFTQSPELLEGRVKTLHPKIHGSILQKDLDNQYQDSLVDLDVVVCNLYPFEECLKKDSPLDVMVENIDIGGVTLLRAAAKNFQRVTILSNPSQYDFFMNNYGNFDNLYGKELSTQAFLHTSLYDSKITTYLSSSAYQANFYEKRRPLKYGANPHQGNAFYLERIDNTKRIYHKDYPFFEVLNGSPGYINYLDAYGAWNLVHDIAKSLKTVCAASFKHTSPAGVSINTEPLSDSEIFNIVGSYDYSSQKYDITKPSSAFLTYARARNCDPKSSFGDFIAINTIVDINLANYLKTCISDGIVALEYTPEALEVLKTKKNGNYVVLRFNEKEFENNDTIVSTKDFGKFSLSQDENTLILDQNEQDIETILGMTTLKYTQSNSTCFVYNNSVIGIGAGQQNRVDCVCIARQKAFIWFMRHYMEKMGCYPSVAYNPKAYDNTIVNLTNKTERLNYRIEVLEKIYHCDVGMNDLNIFKNEFNFIEGLTLCSDGFFPFTDSINEAQKINVSKLVHPGGSVSDEKIKTYCSDNNITYVETGKRYFYH